MHLTDEQANELYDLLVAECGASKDQQDRETFVQQINSTTEYRCCFKFGFGGKIYRTSDRLYIGAYPEDLTPQLLKALQVANDTLKTVQERWKNPPKN